MNPQRRKPMTKKASKTQDCDQCRLNSELVKSLWAISIVAKSLAEKVNAMHTQRKAGGDADAT